MIIVAYLICLARKYRARTQYLASEEQALKDKYTQVQRSCQWAYDHFVFPYIMLFNLLSFFQCVSLLAVPSPT